MSTGIGLFRRMALRARKITTNATHVGAFRELIDWLGAASASLFERPTGYRDALVDVLLTMSEKPGAETFPNGM